VMWQSGRMDWPQFVLRCCGYEEVKDWKDRRKEGKNFYVHMWTCFIFIIFEVRCIQAGSRAHTVSIKWETRTLSLRKKGQRPGIHLFSMACRGTNLPPFHSFYELTLHSNGRLWHWQCCKPFSPTTRMLY